MSTAPCGGQACNCMETSMSTPDIHKGPCTLSTKARAPEAQNLLLLVLPVCDVAHAPTKLATLDLTGRGGKLGRLQSAARLEPHGRHVASKQASHGGVVPQAGIPLIYAGQRPPLVRTSTQRYPFIPSAKHLVHRGLAQAARGGGRHQPATATLVRTGTGTHGWQLDSLSQSIRPLGKHGIVHP